MQKMFANQEVRIVQAILDQLVTLEGEEFHGYLVTGTREDYDRLLRAALAGWTPEIVNLGRSGMRMNKKVIIPPDRALYN